MAQVYSTAVYMCVCVCVCVYPPITYVYKYI